VEGGAYCKVGDSRVLRAGLGNILSDWCPSHSEWHPSVSIFPTTLSTSWKMNWQKARSDAGRVIEEPLLCLSLLQ
jgi:hypothetical protein